MAKVTPIELTVGKPRAIGDFDVDNIEVCFAEVEKQLSMPGRIVEIVLSGSMSNRKIVCMRVRGEIILQYVRVDDSLP